MEIKAFFVHCCWGFYLLLVYFIPFVEMCVTDSILLLQLAVVDLQKVVSVDLSTHVFLFVCMDLAIFI